MLSFNLKSKRIGNKGGHFKKYNVTGKYVNNNVLVNNELITPDTLTLCEKKVIQRCTNGETSNVYCKRSMFRRPLPGYRKELVVCKPTKDASGNFTNNCVSGQLIEEVYKDPYSLSACKGEGTQAYDRRIRTMNHKNGVKDLNYNYNYGQYLRNRCKSFEVNEKRFLNDDGTYRSNCTYTRKDKNGNDVRQNCITYKNKNPNFSTNSAVSSSSRLARLRNNTIMTAKDRKCENGEPCRRYKSYIQNNNGVEPNIKKAGAKDCYRRRIGGVMRKCYR